MTDPKAPATLALDVVREANSSGHGYDAQWIEGSERSARYARLPPGDYRFEVRARDSGGVWGPVAARDITLAPLLHQTLWFQLSCALAALATAALVRA